MFVCTGFAQFVMVTGSVTVTRLPLTIFVTVRVPFVNVAAAEITGRQFTGGRVVLRVAPATPPDFKAKELGPICTLIGMPVLFVTVTVRWANAVSALAIVATTPTMKATTKRRLNTSAPLY
jgi:hypothetical protein